MKRSLLLALLLGNYFAPPAFADPLKLLSTSPQFWATNINSANQKAISLTFDQRLRATLTDWVGLDILSPPSELQTKFSPDHMSCSIDVHLDPGRVYICALNGRGIPGVGFQNEKGLPLLPTFLVFQTAGTVAPQDAPPRVLRSNPQHGATGLDSTRVRSLTITFDKPMNVKKHGLHMFENNSPVDLLKAQFAYSEDGLTFTLAYPFKSATQYRFELNDIHDIGFASANQVPLWPVQISVSTMQ
jgi:Bacterial Ig-like domain